ncbi:MAG: hypothetical protein HOK74_04840 [Nitrosomonadales bacterium]|nr:hypothetical protein [Nitrosomonadales bacterium]
MRPIKPASPRVVKKPSKLIKTLLGTKTDPSIDRRIKIRTTVILTEYNQQTLIGIKKNLFIILDLALI